MSQGRLFEVIHNSDDVLVMGVDNEGVIVLFNPACERISGYSRDEAIGRHFGDFYIPDEIKQDTLALLDRAKAGESGGPFDYFMRTKDGKRRLISWNVFAVPAQADEPGLILGIGTDITASRETEDVLSASEEHFRLLIENALDLIMVVRADAVISYVSPSVERLLGYKPEELRGSDLIGIIHEDDIETAGLALDFAKGRPGVTGNVELRIRHKDGSWRVHEANSFNLLDNPSVQGLVINSRDVTDRKAVEEELVRRGQEMEAIFQALPDFYFRIAADGTIIDYRAGKSDDLYVAPEEFLGKRVQDMLPPEVRLKVLEAIQKIIDGEPSITFEYSLPWPGGERIYEARMMPALANEIITLIRNITERKQSERLIKVQRDMAIRFDGVSELHQALEESLQAILTVTGMDCGGIYLVDENSGELDLAYHQGLSEAFVERTRHYDADSENARMVASGEPLYIEHAELGLPQADPSGEEGLRAVTMVPIKSGGRMAGSVNVGSHIFDEIPERLRNAIEVLAGQIGQSFSRDRLVSAQRESEERYRLLHDYAGQAILTYDREMRVVSLNLRACEIMGRSTDEVIERNIFDLNIIHPDDVEQARRAAHMFFSGLKSGRGEMRFLKKDGSVMIGEVTGAVLYNEEGEAIAVTNIVNDITSNKMAEQALIESEEIYRVTFESTGTAMIIIGLDGTILDGNHEVQKLLGYSGEEVFGKRKYMEFVHPDDLRIAKRHSIELFKGNLSGPVHYEARTVRGDGRVIDTLIHVSMLPGMDKSVASIIDITEKKEYERELVDRAEQLKDFLDVAAHELRHPATLVKGFAATLEKFGTEMSREDVMLSLEAIEKGSDQLTNVVNDLLDISRIERGPLALLKTQQDLRQIVYRAVEEMMVRGGGNSVEVDLVEELGTVWLDADKLLRLMIILLDNAMKYSPKDSLIEVKGEAVDSEALISVMDRGEGVPEEERGMIFDRFYQSEAALHHSSPGLGLGLYIGKRIVEAHGGKIWYEPHAGGGSVFRFTLPLYRTE